MNIHSASVLKGQDLYHKGALPLIKCGLLYFLWVFLFGILLFGSLFWGWWGYQCSCVWGVVRGVLYGGDGGIVGLFWFEESKSFF